MAAVDMAQPAMAAGSPDHNLFTCLSCSIAFHSANDQRDHYRSDHHRYNMKRRVAGLPPVGAETFNQKVLERRAETAVMASPKGSTCDICSKTYTTENAYRSHLNSKKHKENELKAASRPRSASPSREANEVSSSQPDQVPPFAASDADQIPPSSQPELAPIPEDPSKPTAPIALTVDADASEADITSTIDAKIAAARARLSPTQCLFCPADSPSLALNLTHMSSAHSFFVPDAEYLVDLPGLITYLGEKIAVGNVCIYCNGKGREFRTLEAVRKHMVDKGHCKIAYDTDAARLEVSDYYDFTASYPDAEDGKSGRSRRRRPAAFAEPDGEWEDVEEGDDEDVDEVVEEDESDESDDLPDNQITYGDTPFELVLPSGARIGHREMRRYYAQSFPTAPRGGRAEDPKSGAALVRQLLADKNSALVPRKGGFGAFGVGTQVVKARNRGEAREAGRHVREFRDQARREAFKTKVGYIHNHQKHFRDPLLQ